MMVYTCMCMSETERVRRAPIGYLYCEQCVGTHVCVREWVRECICNYVSESVCVCVCAHTCVKEREERREREWVRGVYVPTCVCVCVSV